MTRFIWTVDSVKKVIEMWPTNSSKEIATAIGCSLLQLNSVIVTIRKEGGNLPKKTNMNAITPIVRQALGK